jgi:hypothetical protein
MGNCSNVMWPVPLQEVVVKKQPCNGINAFGDGHGKLRVAILLPADEELLDPHKCLAIPPCTVTCHFDDAERVTGMVTKLTGSIEDLVEGDQVIQVPAGVVVALCYTDANGREYRTQIITSGDYKANQAWVLRTPADKPHAFALYWKPAS